MPTRRIRDGIEPDEATLKTSVDKRGGQIYSAEGACSYLKISLASLEKASSEGMLAPFKVGRRTYYTKRDLDRHRTGSRRYQRDALIVRRLQSGMHPIDVYLELADRAITLNDVLRVTKTWAQVGGLWIVAGPPGSYSRWLQRMNLTRVRPADLRRCIEDMLLGRTLPSYADTLKKQSEAAE